MDPKMQFLEQAELLISETSIQSWGISKQFQINILILTPPGWHLRHKDTGVSLQFALTAQGDVSF
jgi:hypothetical protein